jgi:hypothetical protein
VKNLFFKGNIKIKTNLEVGFRMKHLVLLFVALVFAMGTTVMATENWTVLAKLDKIFRV